MGTPFSYKMNEMKQPKPPLSLQDKKSLLQTLILFEHLNEKSITRLASLFYEVTFQKGEMIVEENQPVDSVFLIVDGNVEIYHPGKEKEILAVLHPMESIGLSDTGFFSETGLRTATAAALTDVTAIKMDVEDFKQFSQEDSTLISHLSQTAKKLARQNFIKQTEPFQEIPQAIVQKIAEKVEERKISQGTLFFKEGDPADCSYLLCKGKIEIRRKGADDSDIVLETLDKPTLFGEIGLLTGTTRSATVQALTPCEVLILQKRDIEQLLHHPKAYEALSSMMLSRFLPKQNEGVTIHKRLDSKNEMIIILKQEKLGNYFKTSEEGLFVWNLLDGNHTLKDINLEFFWNFNKLAVNYIGNLILGLMEGGFIHPFRISLQIKAPPLSRWQRFFDRLSRILTYEYAIKNIDDWLTKIYNQFGYLFFTRIAQVLMMLISLFGIAFFFPIAIHAQNTLQATSHSWTLLLLVDLCMILSIPLHEFAHALSTKSYGYQVHSMGVGWFWMGPIAFTDTSDMWLASRGPRLVVNLAGIYINLVFGGLLAIVSWMTSSSPLISTFIWLCALSNYLLVLGNLDPLFEFDGYYILMDALDKVNLRAYASVWLWKIRKCKKEYFPEICYWVACIAFIFTSAGVAYLVQNHVLIHVFPEEVRNFFSKYLKWLFFVFVLFLSFRNLYIRSRKFIKSLSLN